MCPRSVKPHLLPTDPVHKTLDNRLLTYFVNSLLFHLILNRDFHWIHVMSSFNILIQCSILSLSIFFKVPINIGIHKWTLGYNSFLQFWKPISASKYLFWGEFKISMIVRFKFLLSELVSAFVWNSSGVGCLQLRERTRYWCRNQQGALSDQLLGPKRNCRAREIVRENCKVRKVSAKIGHVMKKSWIRSCTRLLNICQMDLHNGG